LIEPDTPLRQAPFRADPADEILSSSNIKAAFWHVVPVPISEQGRGDMKLIGALAVKGFDVRYDTAC
jgi:hypothetical protein